MVLRTDVNNEEDAALVHAGLHNDANAKINELEAELDASPKVIVSATPPEDTTAIWVVLPS